MIAIHDQFTRRMRNRLKTTGMGLGLVRLLQNAKRFGEARTTLYTLEGGFQGVDAGKSKQKPCKATRLKDDSRSVSFVPLGTNQELVHSIN